MYGDGFPVPVALVQGGVEGAPRKGVVVDVRVHLDLAPYLLNFAVWFVCLKDLYSLFYPVTVKLLGYVEFRVKIHIYLYLE